MHRILFVRISPVVLFVLLTGFGVIAQAGQGADELKRFFTGLETLSADFQQILVNERGDVMQDARGRVNIHRPGRFRWDYEMPYRQLVLADGKRLWTYDEDLEQATVKPADEVLGGTPATLLSSLTPPEEVFEITELGVADGFLWVGLKPKEADGSFQEMQLGFGKTLERMIVKDVFGQTTRFSYTNIRRNQALETNLFSFTPPRGVDVLGAP